MRVGDSTPTRRKEQTMANCNICRGACCESITLEITGPTNDFQRFLEYRTSPQITGKGRIGRNFECRCLMLKDGRCLVYEKRPKMCADFEPGGEVCRATVATRRTPEEAKKIFGED